eukprot:6656641-Alexandrium_andersonii.AAC.1
MGTRQSSGEDTCGGAPGKACGRAPENTLAERLRRGQHSLVLGVGACEYAQQHQCLCPAFSGA